MIDAPHIPPSVPRIPPLAVLDEPPVVSRRYGLVHSSGGALPASAPVQGWADYAVPSDHQGAEPSCVGHTVAGWIELMVRRYIARTAVPAGMQIDGSAIWRRGRERFWRGRMGGGLYLSQGIQAAVDLGLLPRGARAVRVAADWATIGEMLIQAPIVMGTQTWPEWYKADKDNGAVRGSHVGELLGNHATLLLERLVHPGGGWHGLFQNSWGRAWGYHGLGVLDFGTLRNALMSSGLYSVSLPDDWTDYRGFEKFLIKDTST